MTQEGWDAASTAQIESYYTPPPPPKTLADTYAAQAPAAVDEWARQAEEFNAYAAAQADAAYVEWGAAEDVAGYGGQVELPAWEAPSNEVSVAPSWEQAETTVSFEQPEALMPSWAEPAAAAAEIAQQGTFSNMPSWEQAEDEVATAAAGVPFESYLTTTPGWAEAEASATTGGYADAAFQQQAQENYEAKWAPEFREAIAAGEPISTDILLERWYDPEDLPPGAYGKTGYTPFATGDIFDWQRQGARQRPSDLTAEGQIANLQRALGSRGYHFPPEVLEGLAISITDAGGFGGFYTHETAGIPFGVAEDFVGTGGQVSAFPREAFRPQIELNADYLSPDLTFHELTHAATSIESMTYEQRERLYAQTVTWATEALISDNTPEQDRRVAERVMFQVGKGDSSHAFTEIGDAWFLSGWEPPAALSDLMMAVRQPITPEDQQIAAQARAEGRVQPYGWGEAEDLVNSGAWDTAAGLEALGQAPATPTTWGEAEDVAGQGYGAAESVSQVYDPLRQTMGAVGVVPPSWEAAEDLLGSGENIPNFPETLSAAIDVYNRANTYWGQYLTNLSDPTYSADPETMYRDISEVPGTAISLLDNPLATPLINVLSITDSATEVGFLAFEATVLRSQEAQDKLGAVGQAFLDGGPVAADTLLREYHYDRPLWQQVVSELATPALGGVFGGAVDVGRIAGGAADVGRAATRAGGAAIREAPQYFGEAMARSGEDVFGVAPTRTIDEGMDATSELGILTRATEPTNVANPPDVQRLIDDAATARFGTGNTGRRAAMRAATEQGITSQLSRDRILVAVPEGAINSRVPGARPAVADEPPKSSFRQRLESGEPTPPPTPPRPPVEEAVGPVAKLRNLIEQAKPATAETEALRHAEMSRRFGAISGIQQQGLGERGYYESLGALKGERAKAAFEPIGQAFTQAERDELYEIALKSIKTTMAGDPAAGLNLQTPLNKILAGNAPTPRELKLLEDAFGPEVARAATQKITANDYRWLKSTFGPDIATTIVRASDMPRAAFKELIDLLGIPRAVVASMDFSGSLRQAWLFAFSRPTKSVPSAFAGIRAFVPFIGEEFAQHVDDAIRAHSDFPLLEVGGVYLAPIGRNAVELSAREESFMSKWTDLIPGLRQSARSYTTTLNKIRADVFYSMVDDWRDFYAKQGKNLTPQQVREIGNYVNIGTGRGSLPFEDQLGNLGKAVLNQGIFSPRLFTSRVELLARTAEAAVDPRTVIDVLTSNRTIRRELAKDVAVSIGTTTGMLWGLQASGLGSVDLDPRSSDFGKFRFFGVDGKLGPQRMDPWGGFQQFITLAARAISGERIDTELRNVYDAGRLDSFMRFLEGKMSPQAAIIRDVITRRNFFDEPLRRDWETVKREAFNRLVPLFIQDVVDAYRELGVTGALRALPAAFGYGVQTYGPTAGQAWKLAFREEFGHDYDYGKQSDKDLRNNNPRIKALYDRAVADGLEKGREGYVEGQQYRDQLTAAEKQILEQARLAAGGNRRALAEWGDNRGPILAFKAGIGANQFAGFEGPDTELSRIKNEYYAVSPDDYLDENGIPDYYLYFSAKEAMLARIRAIDPVEAQAIIDHDRFIDPNAEGVDARYREASAILTAAPVRYTGLTREQWQDYARFSSDVNFWTPIAADAIGYRLRSDDMATLLADERGNPSLAVLYDRLQSETEREKLRNPEYYQYLADHKDLLEKFFPNLYSQATLEKIGEIAPSRAWGGGGSDTPKRSPDEIRALLGSDFEDFMNAQNNQPLPGLAPVTGFGDVPYSPPANTTPTTWEAAEDIEGFGGDAPATVPTPASPLATWESPPTTPATTGGGGSTASSGGGRAPSGGGGGGASTAAAPAALETGKPPTLAQVTARLKDIGQTTPGELPETDDVYGRLLREVQEYFRAPHGTGDTRQNVQDWLSDAGFGSILTETQLLRLATQLVEEDQQWNSGQGGRLPFDSSTALSEWVSKVISGNAPALNPSKEPKVEEEKVVKPTFTELSNRILDLGQNRTTPFARSDDKLETMLFDVQSRLSARGQIPSRADTFDQLKATYGDMFTDTQLQRLAGEMIETMEYWQKTPPSIPFKSSVEFTDWMVDVLGGTNRSVKPETTKTTTTTTKKAEDDHAMSSAPTRGVTKKAADKTPQDLAVEAAVDRYYAVKPEAFRSYNGIDWDAYSAARDRILEGLPPVIRGYVEQEIADIALQGATKAAAARGETPQQETGMGTPAPEIGPNVSVQYNEQTQQLVVQDKATGKYYTYNFAKPSFFREQQLTEEQARRYLAQAQVRGSFGTTNTLGVLGRTA
jgi:hypothetical protein